MQSTHHKTVRNTLRILGPITALIGLVFVIVGMASFFSSMGGPSMPRYFWCCFVGMPLLFAGTVMCQFGFLGAVHRYVAGESVPVVKDATNYIAEGVSPGLKAAAKAVAEGVVEGLDKSRQQQ